MLYRFTGLNGRFYPQIIRADRKSLVAEPGMVAEFPDGPPGDGLWVPVEDAPAPDDPQPDPEPAEAGSEPPVPA